MGDSSFGHTLLASFHSARNINLSMGTIQLEVADGVAAITLNRPDVLNSFDREMAAELLRVLSQVAQDNNLRAVLLTGAGRGFCAGQDLAEAMPKGGAMPD